MRVPQVTLTMLLCINPCAGVILLHLPPAPYLLSQQIYMFVHSGCHSAHSSMSKKSSSSSLSPGVALIGCSVEWEGLWVEGTLKVGELWWVGCLGTH